MPRWPGRTIEPNLNSRQKQGNSGEREAFTQHGRPPNAGGLADGLEVGVPLFPQSFAGNDVRQRGKYAPWRVHRAGGSPATPAFTAS